MESTLAFAGDDFWCGLHLLRHFRRAVSALRADCCTFGPQSLAPLREPARFLDRIRDVRGRWFRARRALWNRVGILEQETALIRCYRSDALMKMKTPKASQTNRSRTMNQHSF